MRVLKPLVVIIIVAFALARVIPACSQEEPPMAPQVLFSDDFSQGMDNWWTEGGVKVWIEDGRLHVDAEPGGERTERRPGHTATVWCKQPFEGDIKIELEAHVLRSDIEVNNVNFFIHFSDPEGTPLYETRDQREDAGYAKYHVLSGNIITYLSDVRPESMQKPPQQRPARVRIRHCPGFELLEETYAYHCTRGRTYQIEIVREGGRIGFSVDGQLLLETRDPQAPEGGLFGLRTFRTYLWYDNIRITALQ